MNIKDLIGAEENIVWESKPNKTLYIWSTVLPQVLVAIIWSILTIPVMISIFTASNAPELMFFLVPFFIMSMIPVWSAIGGFLKNSLEYPNVLYAATDRRVIIRDGLIGIDFQSIDYAEIDKISVTVSILERIFNVGTIVLDVDGSKHYLKSVKNPYDIFKQIQKISFDVKTDINYPNAKRPENNPGYNTKYDL